MVGRQAISTYHTATLAPKTVNDIIIAGFSEHLDYVTIQLSAIQIFVSLNAVKKKMAITLLKFQLLTSWKTNYFILSHIH